MVEHRASLFADLPRLNLFALDLSEKWCDGGSDFVCGACQISMAHPHSIELSNQSKASLFEFLIAALRFFWQNRPVTHSARSIPGELGRRCLSSAELCEQMGFRATQLPQRDLSQLSEGAYRFELQP